MALNYILIAVNVFQLIMVISAYRSVKRASNAYNAATARADAAESLVRTLQAQATLADSTIARLNLRNERLSAELAHVATLLEQT